MKYLFTVTLAFCLLLTACSAPAASTATTAGTQVSPTSAEASATSAPESTTPAGDATATTGSNDAAGSTPASGVVVFNIVPDESTVSYQVTETFLNQNNRLNVAVGTTGQVSGEIQANMDNPPASTIGEIQVDISQFKSDSNMRDQRIRSSYLESSKYPIAVFDPTKIEGLPDSYVEGQSYNFTVTGNLTVHQTTQEVTFDVTASLQGNTLSGTATTTILMSQFGVGPITILGMLNTEDQALLTFNFVAKS